MGQFNTNGGYFAPRDYFKVETGGSHDENPNGGVQIGMDTQGIPNMLEEGEPVYNDYVYSDNIEADADILRKHNLPVKFAGKLYSEIVDEYIDSSRPLDPISNNGMRAMLTRLADAQEEQKQIKEQQELEEELASLSPEEQEQLLAMLAQQEQAEAGAAEVPVEAQVVPEQIVPEQIAPEQIAVPQQMMAYGGPLKETSADALKFAEVLAKSKGYLIDDVKEIPAYYTGEYLAGNKKLIDDAYPTNVGQEGESAREHARLMLLRRAEELSRIEQASQSKRSNMNSHGGTLLRQFDDGTPGQVVVVPHVYGDTSMLYGDPQREPVVPGPDMTRGGRARAAREAALAAGVNTGSVPVYNLDEIDQAIIDNANARYASIGVDPATGMRTEAPLIDVHPELDVALAYAQPGTLLDKAFAPSFFKSTVNGIMSGEGAMALAPAGKIDKVKGIFNLEDAMKKTEKAREMAVKTAETTRKVDESFKAFNSAHSKKEAIRETLNKKTSRLNELKSEFNTASEAYVNGNINKAQLELLGKKVEEKAGEVARLQDELSAARNVESGARLRAGKEAKSAGVKFKRTVDTTEPASAAGSVETVNEATNKLPKWAKRTLMWGLPAGALGAGAIYGSADGWFDGGFRPAPEWDGSVDGVLSFDDEPQVDSTVSRYQNMSDDEYMRYLLESFGDGDTNQKALGGKVNRYDGLGPNTSHMVRDAIAENKRPWWAGLNYQVTLPTSVPETTTSSPQAVDTSALPSQQDSAPAESYVRVVPIADTTTTHPAAQIYPTAGRYAKAVTSGLVGLYDAFTPADKYRFLPYNPQYVSAQMHLVDPRYRPQDWNSPLAGTLASSAGLARTIAASGNPASAPAALIGLDSSIGKNIGTVANTTWAANNQLYNNVLAARNRNASALGQFDFTKSRVNTGILNDKLKSDIQNDLLAQQLYFTGQGQKAAAIQNQIDVGADELVKDARQNFAFNQLNTNAYLDWLLAPNGAAAYYGSGKKTTKE